MTMRSPAGVVPGVLLFSALLMLAAHPDARIPQQLTFRGGSAFVTVDVYPRRDGRVVDNLRAEDFQIFEDGKPQTLESFDLITVQPVTADASLVDPASASEGLAEAADPRRRVFVVYLDVFHTSVAASHDARAPVINFLRRAVGPNDLFAVVTPEMSVAQMTFARRSDTLDSELATYWTWGSGDRAVSARNEWERRALTCASGRDLVAAYRDVQTLQHVENLVRRLRDLREARTNVLFVSEGWQLANRRRFNAGGYQPDVWCTAQVTTYGNVEFERRFHDLLAEAQRANVSFYPIDAGGLKSDLLPASRPGGASPAETYRDRSGDTIAMLRTLAKNTDGTAVVANNDLSVAARRMADDLASYYLLGYYSTNIDADGRFRRIDVKVNAPNVSVVARRGYLAPTEASRRTASRPVSTSGESALATAFARLGAARPEVPIEIQGSVRRGGIDVVAEISSREIESGRWRAGARVEVAATRSGTSIDRVSAAATIGPGQRAALVTVPVDPGSTPAVWQVTVRLSGAEGTLDNAVDLEYQPDAAVGGAILYRAAAPPRAPFVASASASFRRIERVRIEWPTENPIATPGARLISRRGETLSLPVSLTNRTSGTDHFVVAELSLAPLAQGEYAVALRTDSRSPESDVYVPFRIVP